MAYKLRKTVPQSEVMVAADRPSETARAFARNVPALAFLLPVKRRSARRLTALKKMLAKILGGLIPAFAQQDPQTLQKLWNNS